MALTSLSLSLSLARWFAFCALLVGCAANTDDECGACPPASNAPTPLKSGSFRSVREPSTGNTGAAGADGYAAAEKRMTVDVATNTVEIVFLDSASRRRVERYRIVR